MLCKLTVSYHFVFTSFSEAHMNFLIKLMLLVYFFDSFKWTH